MFFSWLPVYCPQETGVKSVRPERRRQRYAGAVEPHVIDMCTRATLDDIDYILPPDSLPSPYHYPAIRRHHLPRGAERGHTCDSLQCLTDGFLRNRLAIEFQGKMLVPRFRHINEHDCWRIAARQALNLVLLVVLGRIMILNHRDEVIFFWLVRPASLCALGSSHVLQPVLALLSLALERELLQRLALFYVCRLVQPLLKPRHRIVVSPLWAKLS